MECNVGMKEQKLRILAGLTLLGLGAYYNTKAIAMVGLVPIVTAMLRWCPVNQALGYNGCADEGIEAYT
ncbi:DUF2892 domain-containing protein [Pontibacter sp. H259]|uniref:YgaP family membrane protein n=1 Tax=Pontibacter sp. H259 TaxID=3133421 RepID=UPI0030C61E8D